MNLRFRIRIAFTEADAGQKEAVEECTAAVWDRIGRVEYRHEGEMADLIPGWVTGADPLEIPKDEEGKDCELAIPG
ncbi:hypothetical protein [Streptomyces sp. 5-10]|uniref:hypothetical protein n=1 Tax=Streptomyces sp. 5-10 TaxID=878925 RepID=UPI00168A9B68|nr:hypothetical protein [Streptomyces sp. 5-10]MBD3004667.1 hypothetical protein [Streptomyces sp. 5-10]